MIKTYGMLAKNVTCYSKKKQKKTCDHYYIEGTQNVSHNMVFHCLLLKGWKNAWIKRSHDNMRIKLSALLNTITRNWLLARDNNILWPNCDIFRTRKRIFGKRDVLCERNILAFKRVNTPRAPVFVTILRVEFRTYGDRNMSSVAS